MIAISGSPWLTDYAPMVTSRWTVIALVGCEIANDVPISLGGVQVGRLPAHMNFLMPQRGFQIQCEGSTQIVNPQHLDINSETVYWVERTANDAFEAMEAVKQEEDPIIRAVLSATVGRPVMTQVISTWHPPHFSETESGIPVTSWLGRQEIDVEYAVGVGRRLRADARLREACRHLAAGQTYSYLRPSAGDLAEDATLLEYAKCLEYLALDKRWQGGDGDEEDVSEKEEQRRRIVDELTAGLSQAQDTRSQQERISSASRALFALDHDSVRVAVKRMGDQLELGEGWLEAADRLMKARNEHLAHPGRRLPEDVRRGLVWEAVDQPFGAYMLAVRAITARAAHLAGLTDVPPKLAELGGNPETTFSWREPEHWYRPLASAQETRR